MTFTMELDTSFHLLDLMRLRAHKLSLVRSLAVLVWICSALLWLKVVKERQSLNPRSTTTRAVHQPSAIDNKLASQPERNNCRNTEILFSLSGLLQVVR